MAGEERSQSLHLPASAGKGTFKCQYSHLNDSLFERLEKPQQLDAKGGFFPIHPTLYSTVFCES